MLYNHCAALRFFQTEISLQPEIDEPSTDSRSKQAMGRQFRIRTTITRKYYNIRGLRYNSNGFTSLVTPFAHHGAMSYVQPVFN